MHNNKDKRTKMMLEVRELPQIVLYDLFEEMIEEEDNDLDEMLRAYDFEARKHIIVDRSKHQIIDSRLQTSINIANSAISPTPTVFKAINKSKSMWEPERKSAEQLHSNLLSTLVRGQNEDFFALLDMRKHRLIDINYRYQSNWTILHNGAQNAAVEMMGKLINYPGTWGVKQRKRDNAGMDINALTAFGETALHIAVRNGKFEHTALLITAGIGVNSRDNDGNTALHYAATLGQKDIIELLVQCGASKEVRNCEGLLAVDLCSSQALAIKLMPSDGYDPYIQRNHRRKEYREECMQQIPVVKGLLQTNPQNMKKKKLTSRQESILSFCKEIKGKHIMEEIKLSSFKFLRKIGQGGFGEVYVVQKDERLYALKAVSKDKIQSKDLEKYIFTEKNVLAQINHPFVVRLHFAFQNKSHLFLVMDYCAGGDLYRFLKKKGRLSEEEVRLYAAEVLLALQALHAKKVLYRDMKPENIVLDKDGHALLTDFGLSKETESADDLTKSFCGTPAYMALEVINKKGHNRMADWYGFGVVLFELYSGYQPYLADSKAELFHKVREGRICFPQGTPDLFRDLVRRLLHQDPFQRLGCEGDGEAVRSHPWFASVQWHKVMRREQIMPRCQTRLIVDDKLKIKLIDDKGNNMNAWSFIA